MCKLRQHVSIYYVVAAACWLWGCWSPGATTTGFQWILHTGKYFFSKSTRTHFTKSLWLWCENWLFRPVTILYMPPKLSCKCAKLWAECNVQNKIRAKIFPQDSYYELIYPLTHWGWVTHICVCNLTIIGPDNGLSPGRCQAIIWTYAGILLIGPWETNFSEILIGIHTFSFKKMPLKMSSGKWRPFCLGLNELRNGVPGLRCHPVIPWTCIKLIHLVSWRSFCN